MNFCALWETHKSVLPSHCLQPNMHQYCRLHTEELSTTHLMIQDDGEFDSCFSPGLHVVWEYTTSTPTPTPSPPPAAITAINNKYGIMISLYIEITFFQIQNNPEFQTEDSFIIIIKVIFFSILFYKPPYFQIIEDFCTAFFFFLMHLSNSTLKTSGASWWVTVILPLFILHVDWHLSQV